MSGWLTATLAMTIAARELGHVIPVFELMLFRSVTATLILTPIVMLNGGLRGRLSQLPLHLVRNIVHYGGQYAWLSALMLIPLAEVIAIEFTMPLWIAILATAFLAERMYGTKIAALVFGFAGVIALIGIDPGHLNPAILVPLGTAVSYAVFSMLTRELRAHYVAALRSA